MSIMVYERTYGKEVVDRKKEGRGLPGHDVNNALEGQVDEVRLARREELIEFGEKNVDGLLREVIVHLTEGTAVVLAELGKSSECAVHQIHVFIV